MTVVVTGRKKSSHLSPLTLSHQVQEISLIPQYFEYKDLRFLILHPKKFYSPIENVSPLLSELYSLYITLIKWHLKLQVCYMRLTSYFLICVQTDG